MDNLSSARLRAIYNQVKSQVPATTIVKPNHFLQAEAQLVAGTTTYDLIINRNQRGGVPVRSSEILLDQNDAFVAVAVAIFLKNENPTTASGLSVLQTYPASAVFPPETGNVSLAHLEGIYNGPGISIKVGDTVYSDNLDINPCRVRRTDAAEKLSFDGFIETEPVVTFDGGLNTQIKLNINQNAREIQYVTAATRISVAFRVYGMLVSGGSGIGLKVNAASYGI